MTVPASNKQVGDSGHVSDHNAISTVLGTKADIIKLTRRQSSRYFRNQVGAAVMTTPPTQTPVNSGSSSITGAVLVAHTDSRYRYEGLAVVDSTGSHFGYKKTFGSGGGVGLLPWRVSFDFDGQVFDVKLFGVNSNFPGMRVYADDQPATAGMSFYNALATGDIRAKVDFGTRARRRITLELVNGIYFGGVWRAPVDTITTPTSLAPVKFGVLGDSFGVGQGATHLASGYVHTLARLLGWPNTATMSAGGTGFTAANAPEGSYLTRLPDVYTFAPDVLLVPGSQNDKSAAAGVIQTAATNVINGVKSNLPNCQIILTGVLFPATPTSGAGGFDATRQGVMNAEIAAAASAAGVDYIDPTGWFYGTGTSAGPNGTGNADFYRGSDGAHPTQAGHDAFAHYLAPKVAGLVGLTL